MPSIFGEDLFEDLFDLPFYDDSKVEKKLYGRHAKNLMKTDINISHLSFFYGIRFLVDTSCFITLFLWNWDVRRTHRTFTSEIFSDLLVLLLFSSFVLTMLYTRLLALSIVEC